MKNMFRVLVLALVGICLATVNIAQEQSERDVLYDKFKACYTEKTDNAKIAACQSIGNELVQKYGKDEEYKSIIDWVKGQLNRLGSLIIANQTEALWNNFDVNLKAKKWAESISAGKNMLNSNLISDGEKLDVLIVIATVGFNAYAKDKLATFNTDTLNFSKTVIDKVEKGEKPSSGDNWGLGTGIYKYGSKDNLLAWMNYNIGFIKNFGEKNANDAIPFLYKSTQYANSEISKKSDPYVYIADWYINKMNSVIDERDGILKANNNVQNDEFRTKNGEIRAIAERAADSFARVYKIISSTPANSKAAADLKSKITKLYQFRYGDKAATPAAINAYLTGVSTRPFVNPNTPIVAVVDATPAPAVSTTTVSTPPTAKPTATTPTAKPTPKQTTGKPGAKSAPLKKGTR